MDSVSQAGRAKGWLRRLDLGEVGFVAGVIVALWAITALPYIYGTISAPADKQFMGVLYDVHDTTQYLSWMRESGQGLLVENRLTSEPNDPLFFNAQWWILGRVRRILGLSLMQVYQLFRVVTIALFVIVCYPFCLSYLGDRSRARIALLALVCGGGLGWVWVVVKQFVGELLFPIDVYTIPGNTFFSMLAVPHVAFSATVIMATLWLGFLAVERKDWRYTLAAGLLALFLGMSHIYDLVTVWAVLAVLGLATLVRKGFSWGLFGRLAGVVAISLPAPLYFGYLAYLTPVWKEALGQYDNLQTFTPSPLHLLIFMGFPLMVSLFTLPELVFNRSLSSKKVFVRVWLLTGLVLIYLPIRFQIMLLNGLQIPAVLLAIELLYERFLPWIQKRLAWSREPRFVKWIGLGFVALVLPLNLYLYAWRFVDLRRANYPYYLNKDDVAALAWLETHAHPDDVVLTSLSVGHYLPGLSGNKAFYSSAVMTLDFMAKREMVERFYTEATPDAERQALIERYGIRYVLYGPAERELGRFDPYTSPLFAPVLDQTQTDLFRVVEEG